MMPRIIGVNSNCYHGYSIDEALEGIAAAGFHYVELTATKGWTEHVFPDQSYCYHMGAGANLENIAAASRSTTVYGDGKAETLAIDPYDAYQKELEDFIGHIEAGTPITVITPADVRHVLSVIVAIRESLETQKTVTVS